MISSFDVAELESGEATMESIMFYCQTDCQSEPPSISFWANVFDDQFESFFLF